VGIATVHRFARVIYVLAYSHEREANSDKKRDNFSHGFNLTRLQPINKYRPK